MAKVGCKHTRTNARNIVLCTLQDTLQEEITTIVWSGRVRLVCQERSSKQFPTGIIAAHEWEPVYVGVEDDADPGADELGLDDGGHESGVEV